MFIEAKDDGWWWQLDYWSYKSCKAPVKSSPPTSQHTGRMPFLLPNQQCQSTEGKNITFHGLTPSSPGVFQLCLWSLIAPGYLGGGLRCLSSALWCQYPKQLQEFDSFAEVYKNSCRFCVAHKNMLNLLFKQHATAAFIGRTTCPPHSTNNSRLICSWKCHQQQLTTAHWLSWFTMLCKEAKKKKRT